ncbi:endonuclease/exonuclease/phosphatase family protein [Aromatoleum toluclasticum]|uniref:endonuclease/exonuclease/phosphatase family protein n=1 Tax=Aromatoleum toluclasticum TaxID=92003 RepID=UPI001D18E756|nr:endonuclease/exonuclease/phosphatase family protein [Aromatoleum toluclasticum]MCC4114145.1 endonuclease/exonuclease/phosphatase family protein [Aromatoleum toluclasticum]
MQLGVMSFNIRCASAPDGEHAWAQRKALVIERIRAFDPDLLGLQECRDDVQAAFVRAALPDYEFVGVPRGGEGDPAIEMAPLLYRRAAFDELARGHFWLADEPDMPGRQSWGAAYPRTASWVRLAPRDGSGGPFTFLNTHFDYQGTAREESARLLRDWALALPREEGVIVTGDFNAERDSETFRELTAGGVLREVLQEAGAAVGTYHDYGRAAVRDAIDWILASPHFRTEAAGADTWFSGRRYPSDHFPVMARLAFSQPGSGARRQ